MVVERVRAEKKFFFRKSLIEAVTVMNIGVVCKESC